MEFFLDYASYFRGKYSFCNVILRTIFAPLIENQIIK